MNIDATDRQIINQLQGGFPISEYPYRDAAAAIGIAEADLISRLQRLCDDGILSRFGPMYNAESLGGGLSLCALSAPQERFDEVATLVNAHRTVAHNYAREHELNMWFVIASDSPHDISTTITEIEAETGLKVYNFPKTHEFFIGFKVAL